MSAPVGTWDARVTCTHCIELGAITCHVCGLSGVPYWNDDGTYMVPNHSSPDGPRCYGGFATGPVMGSALT